MFVLSSNYEGWGRTIVEAMSAGVPIVTTDVGCVGSFFRPQIDGRVVQPNDAIALAKDIEEQLTEHERREWMRENAKKQASTFPKAEKLVELQQRAWQTTRVSSRHIGTPVLDGIAGRCAWMGTAAVMGFVVLVRTISIALFWKGITNVDTSYFTLVSRWFQGYGYSYVADIGCASANRGPGYMFFLTAVYGLFGFANFFAQALIQNFFAIATAYFVYRLGTAVSKDRRVGLIAAVLIALHPYTFYHYNQYYHTFLSSFFLVFLLWAVARLQQTKRHLFAVLTGIGIGSLALVQGTILPAMPFIALWLLIRWRKDYKRAVASIVIMATVSIAFITPWTYRNWTVFHRFIPLTNDLGHALAKANSENIAALTELGYPQEVQTDHREFNPDNGFQVRYVLDPRAENDLRQQGLLRSSYLFTDWHPREPFDPDRTCATLSSLSEPEFDAYWKKIGWTSYLNRIKESGLRLPLLKIRSFWSPFLQPSIKYGTPWTFENSGISKSLARLSLTGYTLLLEIAALLGLIVAIWKKRFPHLIPMLTVLGVYTIMHSIFAGYTKYRIPLDNLLAVFCAFSMVWLYDLYRNKNNQAKRKRPFHILATTSSVVSRVFRWFSIRWKNWIDRMKMSWRIWLPTSVLVAVLLAIRILSFSLFWELAARIGDPGFKILVDHWFNGFGYSFAPDVGCPTAFRSPGYLFFITGVYLLFGHENYFSLLLIQSLLAVVVAYFVYRLAYALTHDRRIGLVTMVFSALNPYTFYHYTQFYHTVLSSFFLVFLLWALVRLEQTKRLGWSFLAGISIGCLALIQGTILPATPFLSLWLLVRWKKEWRLALLAIFVMAATSISIIAPWTYRNWIVFQRFVPLSTDVGFGLYKSNNEFAYGLNALGYPQEVIGGESVVDPDDPLQERYSFPSDIEDSLRKNGWFATTTYIADWHPRPPGYRDSCKLMSSKSEPDFAAYWSGKAWIWISNNFWPDFVKLQIQKVLMFWSPYITPVIKSGGQWPFDTRGSLAALATFANSSYTIFLELVALVGLILVIRSKRLSIFAPLLIVMVEYSFMHSIFPGYTKYRVPIDNLMYVFGSIAVIVFYAGIRKWMSSGRKH
jgi:4-amino-4-deoxy-L-arabinose transferase-like glycosyltransferase